MSTSTPSPTPLHRRPDGLDVPGPTFPRLVTVELRKAVDTLTGRWLIAVTGVLVLAALVLASFFQPSGTEPSLQFLLSNAFLPVSLIVPVLGVLLLSGEFSTRSILTTFSLVPSRGRVVGAKTVAAVLLAVTGSLLAGLLTVATAGVVELLGTDLSWSMAWQVPLQVLAAQVVFVLVGVGIGLLCQNTPLGVIVYLVVPTLLSPVVLLVPALQDVGPWIDLTRGTSPLTMSEVVTGREWAQVASVTAIWAALPFGLGLLRLHRREIT